LGKKIGNCRLTTKTITKNHRKRAKMVAHQNLKTIKLIAQIKLALTINQSQNQNPNPN
jgi:hypothetical protein